MVKKLFKHEIAYYLRSMLPVYGILLAIAGFSRFIQFFETDNTVYNTVNIIAILTYVVAIIAVLAMTMVFTITRYYRNLFTSEGYLSFTLPVTSTQHIFTKLSTAVLFHVLSLVVILLSVCIITAGDVLVEVVKAVAYIVDLVPERLAFTFKETTAAQWQVNIWLFVIEFILLFIAAIIHQMLLYYGCITVGQTFSKNRILAAVGVYFGYYMITQAIGTVFIIVSQFLPWETFADIFYAAPIGCIHTLAISYILLNLLIATGLFAISHVIIRRKLNLE